MSSTKSRLTLTGRSALLIFIASAVALAQTQTSPARNQRASRDTYSPVVDVLKGERTVVTDQQLARLKAVPIEAVWGALQARGYGQNFVTDFKVTQPSVKLVGRALTMRYLPVRPDLMNAVQTLGREGDWFYQYNIRAGEDTRPGDVLVVELGGAVDKATFMGDVTGLGIRARGAAGVVIDGGLRDNQEFLAMKDFPVYARGTHASAMADQVGVDWNSLVRIGGATVMPGDVVVGDSSGVLFFPPQLADEVIKAAEDTVYVEDFKREMIQGTKYKARDIYPVLSKELEGVFEEWKKTHPRKQ